MGNYSKTSLMPTESPGGCSTVNNSPLIFSDLTIPFLDALGLHERSFRRSHEEKKTFQCLSAATFADQQE
jgi:hypothetical protein